jgi:microcystin degradation protein MlrC
LRIGIVGCFHETNTFAPGITDIEDFLKDWYIGKQSFFSAFEGTKTSMGGIIDASHQFDFDLLPLFYTQAVPSSMVSKAAINNIMNEMLAQVAANKNQLDGLIVILHGAMVSEEYQDTDGIILKKIREIIPDMPIAVTIDLHANVSDEMVQLSDIMIGYKTYPHIDAYDRALKASCLLVKKIKEQIVPASYIERTNLLISPILMNTNYGPMKLLMDKAIQYESESDVLSISIIGGFAYADVFCAGATIIVITDGNIEKAKYLAKKLSQYMISLEREFQPKLYSLEQAKEIILHLEDSPAVLIESSDNVGAGTPGDATHTLKYLLDNDISYFLMVLHDPEAVQFAITKGIGNKFDYSVGGKRDLKYRQQPLHGEPVHLSGKIRLLSDGDYTHKGPYMAGMKAHMGRTAVISTDNDSVIVLTEKRVAPWDVNHVKSLGIDPAEFKVIIVKAAVAWRSAFGDISKQAIEIDTPGASTSNLNHFKYTNIPKSIKIVSGGLNI